MTIQIAPAHFFLDPIAKYLDNFRRFYPDIHDWFSRISPEFLTGRRRCIALCDKTGILGLAITRLGPHAKLCHVSVSPGARARGCGAFLMSTALSGIVDSGATDVCVTTSEEVYRDYGPFFASAGFEVVDWEPNRYRPGVSEIMWAASPPSLRINRASCPASATIVTFSGFGLVGKLSMDAVACDASNKYQSANRLIPNVLSLQVGEVKRQGELHFPAH